MDYGLWNALVRTDPTEDNMQDVTGAHALAEAGTWLFWRTTRRLGQCGFNTLEGTTMLPHPFSLDEILVHTLP